MREIDNLPNELVWEKSLLEIPWVFISRNDMKIVGSNRHLKAVGQDDARRNWIQVGSFGSLWEAKSFITGEISLDLSSMEAQNGVLYLTPEGFLRCLRYGLLPDDVRDYLKSGITHLGFGPAIKIAERRLLNYPHHLGVWRPYQKLFF